MKMIVAVVAAWLLCCPAASQAQGFAWSDEDAEALTAALAADEYGQVSSLWIEQHGKVLYEKYFHGADADTYHNMRSVGKTVTGMLVGLAIEDGLIGGVDALAAGYFDDLRPFANGDPRKDAMTIRDLLSMSGPLECDDWNPYSRGNEERMYLVEDWSAFFLDLPIKNRPSWEIPDDDGGFGRLFSYCTAGAQLVGEIVERATGMPAPDYAHKRLFSRLGIEPVWNYAATGQAHLGGGLELTTADWAALGRLYLNRGRANGEQVVPEFWVAASLADRVKIDDTTNYGYFWWRPRYEVGGREYTADLMNGSGGNRVYVLPEFGIVFVIVKSDFRDRDAHPKSDRLFADAIVGHLYRDPE